MEWNWCNGHRFGYGTSFDNEGNGIFEGNWVNGNQADEYSSDGNALNNGLKRLKLINDIAGYA